MYLFLRRVGLLLTVPSVTGPTIRHFMTPLHVPVKSITPRKILILKASAQQTAPENVSWPADSLITALFNPIGNMTIRLVYRLPHPMFLLNHTTLCLNVFSVYLPYHQLPVPL